MGITSLIMSKYGTRSISIYLFIMKFVQLGTQIKTDVKKENI